MGHGSHDAACPLGGYDCLHAAEADAGLSPQPTTPASPASGAVCEGMNVNVIGTRRTGRKEGMRSVGVNATQHCCFGLFYAHHIDGTPPLVALGCCGCGRVWHRCERGDLVPYDKNLLAAAHDAINWDRSSEDYAATAST